MLKPRALREAARAGLLPERLDAAENHTGDPAHDRCPWSTTGSRLDPFGPDECRYGYAQSRLQPVL